MALWLRLMVNDQQIGQLYARRLEPGNPEPDDVCSYEYRIELNGVEKGSVSPIQHRFGDGAWQLVRKIIDRADRSTNA